MNKRLVEIKELLISNKKDKNNTAHDFIINAFVDKIHTCLKNSKHKHLSGKINSMSVNMNEIYRVDQISDLIQDYVNLSSSEILNILGPVIADCEYFSK